MRCLTQNLAMFGMGLYIYAGEDLPEAAKEEANAEYDLVCRKAISLAPAERKEAVTNWLKEYPQIETIRKQIEKWELAASNESNANQAA
jgi:hypothetical protein